MQEIDNRYHFIGKPCAKCETRVRYKCNKRCVACRKSRGGRTREQRAKRREYDARNKDKKAACARRHYQKHKEKIKARVKKYREENIEEVRKREKRYKENNKAAVREVKRRWRQNNLQRSNDTVKRWQKNNPDKFKTIQNNYRARRRKAKGSFTSDEWSNLCKKYDSTCLRCGSQDKMTVDHVVPLVKGGTNYIENIQPLCRSCNASKGAKVRDYRTPKLIAAWPKIDIHED